MTSLAELSLRRIESGIPQFPGTHYPERLWNARNEVHAILKKYVPELKFDVDHARAVLRDIDAWSMRNESEIKSILESSTEVLPEKLWLDLGSKKRVRDYLLATFTVAAQGLGPWMSGTIEQETKAINNSIGPEWAKQDAELRLQNFGLIKKLELDGELVKIFSPDSVGAFGVPIVPIVAGVVVLAVGVLAVYLYFSFLNKKVEDNNRIMDRLCTEAQKKGDDATVRWCLDAVKDLQKSEPLGDFIKEIGKIALCLGGGYLVFRYGFPYILDKLSSKKTSK